MALNAKLIRETLAGYGQANDVTERERKERLASMTSEESLAIYEDLVTTWSLMRSSDGGHGRFDAWRLETLMTVRRALDALAAARGDA